MKTVIGIVCLSLILFVGCGNDPTSPDDGLQNLPPQEFLTYDCNQLISQGDSLLDQSSQNYTNVETSILTQAQEQADYLLFPYNTESGQSFAKRMESIYWAENNVAALYQFHQSRVEGDTNQGRLLKSDVSVRLIPSIGKELGDQYVPGMEGTVNRINASEARISYSFYALRNIGIQIGHAQEMIKRLQGETSRQFSIINSKLDTAIGELAGDVNILKSGIDAIIMGQMAEVQSRFDGFCNNLRNNASTVSEASNIVYNYFVSSSQFDADILYAIDRAKAIQNWAITNGEYSEFAYQDPFFSESTEYEVKSITWESSHPASGHFNFSNPKNGLLISLGDLDYVAKMMLTKLNYNSYLYKDDELNEKNSIQAQSFLDLLESSGFKQNCIDAYQAMYSKYCYYMSAVLTPQPGESSPYLSDYFNKDYTYNFTFDFFCGSTGVWHAEGGSQTGSPIGPDIGLASGERRWEAHTLIINTYKKKRKILIPILARLIALETRLRSYL